MDPTPRAREFLPFHKHETYTSLRTLSPWPISLNSNWGPVILQFVPLTWYALAGCPWSVFFPAAQLAALAEIPLFARRRQDGAEVDVDANARRETAGNVDDRAITQEQIDLMQFYLHVDVPIPVAAS